MFMILILHYCNKGGFIDEQLTGSNMTELAWIIEAFAIVAVNCFVLISGYFLVKSNCKYKKLLKIWQETLFYSLTIFLVFKYFFNSNLSFYDSLGYFFPISLKLYWFISIYVVLYLLAPYINVCLNNIDQKMFKKLLIILLTISCLSSILIAFGFSVIDSSNGYGILQFIILYCIGAYIRIYGKKEYSKMICLIKYIFISILIYCSRIILIKLCEKGVLDADINYNMFYKYNSITVMLSSVYLFLFFKNLNIKIKFIENLILKIAPLTLSVYIIHENPLIRDVLYNSILHTDKISRVKEFIIVLPISCISIFSICCIIEFIRINLFKFINYLNNKIILKKFKEEL